MQKRTDRSQARPYLTPQAIGRATASFVALLLAAGCQSSTPAGGNGGSPNGGSSAAGGAQAGGNGGTGGASTASAGGGGAAVDASGAGGLSADGSVFGGTGGIDGSAGNKPARGGSMGAGGGMGGIDGAAGNNSATGGRVGSGGSTGSSTSSCPILTNTVMAVHVTVNVSWPGTLGLSSGSGQFHIWNTSKLTAAGNTLTGKSIPCGNIIPETAVAALAGGGKLLLEIPTAFWDSQQAPEVATSGELSGWSPTSTIKATSSPALIGLTMTDPNAAWPASYTAITAVDVDRDGAPGLTAIPKIAAGYVNPPLALLGSERADRVAVALRTQLDLSGSFVSCNQHAGQATVKYLDIHVVGCHVAGGGDCTASQVKFLDDNRMAYTISGGTYVAKIVADTTTCADVRAALP